MIHEFDSEGARRKRLDSTAATIKLAYANRKGQYLASSPSARFHDHRSTALADPGSVRRTYLLFILTTARILTMSHRTLYPVHHLNLRYRPLLHRAKRNPSFLIRLRPPTNKRPSHPRSRKTHAAPTRPSPVGHSSIQTANTPRRSAHPLRLRTR